VTSEERAEPDFEQVVSALLKVDPEGITGQSRDRGKKRGKRKPENDESPAPE